MVLVSFLYYMYELYLESVGLVKVVSGIYLCSIFVFSYCSLLY